MDILEGWRVVEPFATVDDLEAEWRPLSESEKDTARHRLKTASTLIRRMKPTIDEEAEQDEVLKEVLTFVVCDMVKASMNTAEVPQGVTQFTNNTGPFSQTMQLSNPNENLFFKKMHRRLLGLDEESFTVDLLGDPTHPGGLKTLTREIWVSDGA